ncbi:uncharacterized protein LOC144153331 [Haemaphysalis longicornis]
MWSTFHAHIAHYANWSHRRSRGNQEKLRRATPFLALILLGAVYLQLVPSTLSEQSQPCLKSRPTWEDIQRSRAATARSTTPVVWPTPLTINVVAPGDYGIYEGNVSMTVSPDDATHITLMHNQLRRIVQSGILPNFPEAGDMLRLEYDLILAWRAQVHSQNCEFKHGCTGCGDLA